MTFTSGMLFANRHVHLRVNTLHVATGDKEPFHMSPVIGLAGLPGQILLFVHMGNFSPGDRDVIKETQPKRGET